MSLSAPSADIYFSPSYLRARKIALIRAHWRCEDCGKGPHCGVDLEVHHIKPVSRFPELVADEANLQVLCPPCHMGGHWLEWGIKQKAANDPRYQLPRRRQRESEQVPEQLRLPM